MDEENIVAALKNGDMSQLDKLYEIYAQTAVRTAFLITSDFQTAEDAVQDTFIQCMHSICTLKNNSAFKPWFYKILTRTAYKAVKKSKMTVPSEDIQSDTAVCDKYPSDSAFLYESIKRLDPKMRTVIVLFYYNGLKISEIAKILHIPQGTVKSRLNTAKKQLAKNIGKEDLYG